MRLHRIRPHYTQQLATRVDLYICVMRATSTHSVTHMHSHCSDALSGPGQLPCIALTLRRNDGCAVIRQVRLLMATAKKIAAFPIFVLCAGCLHGKNASEKVCNKLMFVTSNDSNRSVNSKACRSQRGLQVLTHSSLPATTVTDQ